MFLYFHIHVHVHVLFHYRNVDFYHTCYCLSGLSVAQHQIQDPNFILGGPTNLLKSTDVRFNLVKGKAEAMANYFGVIL